MGTRGSAIELVAEMFENSSETWDVSVQRLLAARGLSGPRELGEAASWASYMCQRYAEITGYLDERHGYGCGDQGHEAAKKQAAHALHKVRKALGYST